MKLIVVFPDSLKLFDIGVIHKGCPHKFGNFWNPPLFVQACPHLVDILIATLEAYGLEATSFSLLKNYSANLLDPPSNSNSEVKFLKAICLGSLLFNIFLYLTFDTKCFNLLQN